MRLWHEKLIKYLPNMQLLGQHRECCALRGNGWGKKHSTVDYVFTHKYEDLYNYHMKIIKEMQFRNFKVDNMWLNGKYRGKKCEPKINIEDSYYQETIYNEHNKKYLNECIYNLKNKNTKPFNFSNWEEIEKILI
ncbi:Pyrimidine dimer DNA glycosylase [compost metagenome]